MLVSFTSISAQSAAELTKEQQYKASVRQQLALDYSMPDYSTSSINAKVMGPRLAKMLEYIRDNYQQFSILNALSMIQSSQVEGLNYGMVKMMKLKSVTKQGNVIRIVYKTTLEPNNLNLKSSQLTLSFIDGVSEDKTVNDFFCNISRYIKD